MGLALTPDGKTLYAAAGENKRLLKIDTATNKVVGTLPMPGIVHESTLTLDGKFLYVTLRKANRVSVIRTHDLEVVTEIPQPGYPDLVVMSPDGTKAYVSNRHADVVSVIGLTDHRELRRITVGKGPHGMALGRPPRP